MSIAFGPGTSLVRTGAGPVPAPKIVQTGVVPAGAATLQGGDLQCMSCSQLGCKFSRSAASADQVVLGQRCLGSTARLLGHVPGLGALGPFPAERGARAQGAHLSRDGCGNGLVGRQVGIPKRAVAASKSATLCVTGADARPVTAASRTISSFESFGWRRQRKSKQPIHSVRLSMGFRPRPPIEWGY